MAIQSQELKRKERINGMQELDHSLSGNEKAKILIFERPLEIQESLKIITNLPERIKTLKHFILMKFSLPENKRPIKVETKLRLDCKLGHMADILDSLFPTNLLPHQSAISEKCSQLTYIYAYFFQFELELDNKINLFFSLASRSFPNNTFQDIQGSKLTYQVQARIQHELCVL